MYGSDEGIKLRLFDVKVLVTILVNVYGITLVVDVGTQLGSLNESLDGSHDGKIDGLFLVGSLGYTGFKVYGYDEVIKLGSNDGKVLFRILVNVDGMRPRIDVLAELGYFYEFVDGSSDDKLKGLLLGGLLGSTDGKFYGSDESVKFGSTGVNVVGTILVIVYGITIGTDAGT